MGPLLGRRGLPVRLITELRRYSVIATVLAPAGTRAETASADVHVVTRSAVADSGAGASGGAVARPSGVRRGAAAAGAARAGGAVHVAPAATPMRTVAAAAIGASALPRLSCTVAMTR